MKRQYLVYIAIIAFMLALPVAASGDEAIKVTLDGSTLTMSNQPLMINDRVYLPIRDISEALGLTVNWDNEFNTVVITKPAAPVIPVVTPPKTLRLNGQLTTWPYWVKDDNLYLEYRDAIALCHECTGSRVYTMTYVPNSKIFSFNNDSINIDYTLQGEYKVINVSTVDRYFANISFSFDPATGEVTATF